MRGRGDQRLRIIHLRTQQDLACRAGFNALTRNHPNHPVAKQADNIKIVADKNKPDRYFPAKTGQQTPYFRS